MGKQFPARAAITFLVCQGHQRLVARRFWNKTSRWKYPDITGIGDEYTLKPRYVNMGNDPNINIPHTSFGNGTKFKYLDTARTNINYINEEINRIFNSGNAY
jgi:hypothetical protein